MWLCPATSCVGDMYGKMTMEHQNLDEAPMKDHGLVWISW